jgi:hypothetical protein
LGVDIASQHKFFVARYHDIGRAAKSSLLEKPQIWDALSKNFRATTKNFGRAVKKFPRDNKKFLCDNRIIFCVNNALFTTSTPVANNAPSVNVICQKLSS